MTSTINTLETYPNPSLQNPEGVDRFDPNLLEALLSAEPRIDKESGLRVVELEVSDGSENYPGRSEFNQVTEAWQAELKAHPEYEAPERPRDEDTHKTLDVIPRNPISAALYAEPEAVKWGRLMPDSYALWNLYHPNEETLPDGTQVTERMRAVFNHLLDARGIRIRGKMIETLGIKYALQNPDGAFSWISHGGGAAAPAMHAAEALNQLAPNARVRVDVYDLDEDAMEFGAREALARGLTEKAEFVTHFANFKNDFLSGRSPAVHEALARGGASYVENSGLTEYFNDRIATMLVKNGYESTAPGGGFVFSNMRDDREQLDLNQRGVGWNKMYVRSLADLANLMRAAGIDPSTATVYQPSDGLYSIVEIAKPAADTLRDAAAAKLGHVGASQDVRVAS